MKTLKKKSEFEENAADAAPSFAAASKLALVSNAGIKHQKPLGQVLPFRRRKLDRWFQQEVLPLEPMLRRFLRRNWHDQSEIVDLQQEVYIRICKAARQSSLIETKSLLFLIARNLMIDTMRRKKIVTMESIADFEWLRLPSDGPTPEDLVSARQELLILQQALDGLPPRCRQVVVLRKIEGYSQRAVASRMGIAEGTVEHQLVKGIRILVSTMARVRPQSTAGKCELWNGVHASADFAKENDAFR